MSEQCVNAAVGVVRRIASFIRNCSRSPKSTAMGVVALTVGIRSMITSPVEFLSNETALVAFITGAGLLFTADQSGAAAQKK